MPKKQSIPPEIQAEVLKIVEEFNLKTFKAEQNPILTAIFGKTKRGFAARFKGKFLYLDRTDRGRPSEICRLTWNGKIDNWGFAIYRHSRNFYDPAEWMFPGAGYVNGTVEGAMKAGMEAYPM
ncbi:hypothetical protein GW866_00870 [bacterium]|nr:hypothetical protein [bacterium]PIW20087.1 MAG: hypothetical protein COW33_03410 [Anaerolineae bacterium CG17_big_fil_post_rev_8_21_14_2_50_57_27]PIZ25339.1 MAG: hypothetical protein COY47_06470 [Chloroflexi bacterium CG_4_10_14_0_8_um_filter_57_5]PJH76531.1 MAG: hypothetical protein CO064_00770 [Anaerolineae bacterium CG_4_9_14_0_8_um_filter_58_9]